jgi:hypothetical protein
MRENICEDRRVIERNGFKKFSKKNQRKDLINDRCNPMEYDV